ncbi:transcription factor bHLH95-like [Quillaja saponaria]|uniref:Transcription factor bHLH95-like n=1 Tax=Quillaja saponaria TaxID=32244 RepID=A0AAD7M1Q9_QUISA|nr:transcription factor bHLH95-like [Quillaja saponaria]
MRSRGPGPGAGVGTINRFNDQLMIINDGQEKEQVEVDDNNKKQSQGGGGGVVVSRVNTRNGKRSCINGEEDHQVKDGNKVGESDHEIHIWTERERRKKMRNMFSSLHALLPQLPSKQKLQKLQKQKLERLQSASNAASTFRYEPTPTAITPRWIPYNDQYSREAFLADQVSSNLPTNNVPNTNPSTFSIPRYPVAFQTFCNSNVVLNVSGDDAQISICSTKKACLFTAICCVLEKHKIDVITAHVSSDGSRNFYMIQAHANGGGSDQFPEASSLEEAFKQAASEISMWVT